MSSVNSKMTIHWMGTKVAVNMNPSSVNARSGER